MSAELLSQLCQHYNTTLLCTLPPTNRLIASNEPSSHCNESTVCVDAQTWTESFAGRIYGQNTTHYAADDDDHSDAVDEGRGKTATQR